MAAKSDIHWENLGARRIAKIRAPNFPNAGDIVRHQSGPSRPIRRSPSVLTCIHALALPRKQFGS
jgi:hypothetical protein